MKKELEADYAILLIDMEKLEVNIWRIKIKIKNLYVLKKEYIIHIKNSKQALNQRLVLKKVNKVIEFNQKAWLKSYIEMNTELSRKAKNDFEKDFFKLMSNSVLDKTMESVQKHQFIKLETIEKRRNLINLVVNLVPEPNYHIT